MPLNKKNKPTLRNLDKTFKKKQTPGCQLRKEDRINSDMTCVNKNTYFSRFGLFIKICSLTITHLTIKTPEM